MKDGAPDLRGLAGLDFSKYLAQYGPGIMKLMTPGTTEYLARTFIPAAKMAGTLTSTPRIRTDAKRKLIKYGPFTMYGQGIKKPGMLSRDDGGAVRLFSLDPKGQAFVSVILDPICDDKCTILAGQTGLMSEDGKPLGAEQGMYIHHILSADYSKPMTMPVLPCDSADVNKPAIPNMIFPGSGFMGQGEDNGDSAILFTSKNGSFDSGFHATKNDKFIVQSDIVNYSNETRKVFLTFDLEYLDGIHGQDATPNLLSVTGCKIAAPKVNATGVATTTSQKFPVTVNGTIVSAKGHMHNGGDAMILRINGKDVCKSDAIYKDDQIISMSGCDIAYPVRVNDAVELESVYDLAKHPLRKDADGHSQAHDLMGGMDVMGKYQRH